MPTPCQFSSDDHPRKWQVRSLGPSTRETISEMQRMTSSHPILKHARGGFQACVKGVVEWCKNISSAVPARPPGLRL